MDYGVLASQSSSVSTKLSEWAGAVDGNNENCGPELCATHQLSRRSCTAILQDPCHFPNCFSWRNC